MAGSPCRCCSHVSENIFERSRRVGAPPELVAQFFREGNAWFRLNPEWEVLSFADGRLRVRYERSEQEAEWRITTAEFGGAGGTVMFEGDPPRRIVLGWVADAEGGTRLNFREEFQAPVEVERTAELGLWLDAAAGYIALAARSDWRARSGKWLLDRIWLKMSPTARRVGIIIIAMEAMALLLFIAIVLIDRLFG